MAIYRVTYSLIYISIND